MLCEPTTLSCPLLRLDRAAIAAGAWTGGNGAKGRLLGCWRTEFGTLGRVIVLRGFETARDLAAERRRALQSSNPFNVGSLVTILEMDSYSPFPLLPPIRIGDRGGIYEFRTYRLKHTGLSPTLADWEAAIESAREHTQHLVVNMFALDGAPRIRHIWSFSSLEQRAALRERAYAAGIWPPKGGPEQIVEATSTIALPQRGSPLT